MAQRIETFHMTAAASATTNFTPGATMQDGIVVRLDVIFPNGCAGLVAVTVNYAGARALPFTSAENLTGNNYTYTFELDDYPTGQGWQVSAVNSDVIAHTFRVLFHCDPVVSASDSSKLLPWYLVPGAGS